MSRKRTRKHKSTGSSRRSLVYAGVAAVVVAGIAAAWYVNDARRAERLLAQAQALYETGAFEASIVALDEVLELTPRDPLAYFHLARAYLRSGDGAKAKKALEQAEELGLEHPDIEVLKVQALLIERDYDRAIGAIDEAQGDKPDADWLALRGQAQLAGHRVDDAWSTFSSALDHDPGNPAARRGMARVAIVEGDTEEAEAQIEQALESADADVQTWILKGELELLLDRLEPARESFERALALSDDDWMARIGLARTLLAQGKVDEAEAQSRTLLSLRPEHPMPYYLAALVADRRGNRDDVKRLLRRVLQAAPDHGPSLLLLGQIHYDAREFEQAEELVKHYLGAIPDHAAAIKLYAAIQIGLGRPADAITTLAPLEERAPEDPQLLELLGSAHSKGGDLDKGQAYLGRAAALAPADGSARAKLAVGHLIAGASATAVAELEAAAAETGSTRTQSLLVLALVESGEYDRALEVARGLGARHPDDPRAHNAIGAVLEARGDTDGARGEYERALALDPDYVTGAMNLARLDLQGGRMQAARARFESIVERHPDHPEAMVALARITRGEGRTEEALKLLEQAREANPQALSPRLALAGHYLRAGDAAKALEYAREVYALAPNDPRAMAALGRSRLESGDADGAVPLLEQLAERMSGSADAQFRLAVAYEQQGDIEGMRRSLERTLEIAPDHLLAKAGLAGLALQAGDAKGALRIADAISDKAPQQPAGHLLRGDVLAAQGDAGAAADAYRRAYESAPHAVTLKKLHQALLAAGRADEAVANLQTWLGEHPHDVGFRLVLASTLERMGQDERALIEYERVLFDQPENPWALNNLALLYHRRGDARSVELAQRAYERLPKLPPVVDTYGWILVSNGRLETGLKMLDRALEQAPDNPAIRFHHAAGLALAGRTDEARSALRSLVDSGQPFAERERAVALLGQLE